LKSFASWWFAWLSILVFFSMFPFLLFLSHVMHCVSFVCSQFHYLVARNPFQVKLFVCLLCVTCIACSQTFGILFLPIQTCAS
jgi:hypothetical protein